MKKHSHCLRDGTCGQRAVRMLDLGDAAGEPVFVPRSAFAPEGDGYVIALAYRAATNTSKVSTIRFTRTEPRPPSCHRSTGTCPIGSSLHF